MHCKNCNNNLRTDYSFCPDCGAKVIRNRITAKNLWFDVVERYFNWDNTLIRTIKDMLLKPEIVCQAYISGIRKKYLNPISLLAISLTLSGLILFLMQKVAWGSIDFSGMPFYNGEGSEKVMAATMEYSSLIFLFYIPLLAFCAFIFFNSKNYNLPEHVITAMYALGAFSIISFPYSFLALLFKPQLYMDISLYVSVGMIIYCLYVVYRNSTEKAVQLLWKVPAFLLVFLIGFFGVSLVVNIFMLLTGVISLSDLAPKP